MGKKPKRKSPTQKLKKNLKRELAGVADLKNQVLGSAAAAEELSFSQEQLEKILISYKELVNNVFKLNISVSELNTSDEKSISRFIGKLKFFVEDLPRNCEKAGIRMTDLSGLEYLPNLNIRVVNEEDFVRGEKFVVDEMIEPHLLFNSSSKADSTSLAEQVLQPGLVSIKKAGI